MSNEDFPAPPRRSDQIPMRMSAEHELPPHPLDKFWFVHVDGQNYGPYSGHEIKRMVGNGQIKDSDFLCPQGGSAWVQAKNEPLLGALFRTQTAAPPQSTVTTTDGGTIVQITNNIPNPNVNLAQALLLAGEDAAPKSPGVALVLSLLITGVGQMYNGQVGKGFAMLLGTIFLWFIWMGWIIWIWSMVDAYSTAKQMNLRYQQRLLAGIS